MLSFFCYKEVPDLVLRIQYYRSIVLRQEVCVLFLVNFGSNTMKDSQLQE